MENIFFNLILIVINEIGNSMNFPYIDSLAYS